jgi:hypothetical protein
MSGGTFAAIRAIRSSEIMPGPLGIAPTRPNAAAPAEMAVWASSSLLMQQILTRIIIKDYLKEGVIPTQW